MLKNGLFYQKVHKISMEKRCGSLRKYVCVNGEGVVEGGSFLYDQTNTFEPFIMLLIALIKIENKWGLLRGLFCFTYRK